DYHCQVWDSSSDVLF
nr:immunoglobulin light chain junction region [Macaca mulatta]MOV72515.1 immunoglobulin light chain junction region [Macaca mulatta]MOV72575.1 immunoglobulin light chain junction region [Macaca mulatta]MOV72726.1 immunoglobulin light chain junction region [Macaca mulatta]MOV73304.1 immunoglobulin light chain junction region [Macaca mulatta]